MVLQKKLVVALLTGGMAGISGQAFAHWSSGPFLYNDAGTNPLNLANSNLAAGVENHGTGANAAGTFGTNTATGTSYGTYTQTRAVSSDYGWIQGQDNSLWANSHDNKGLAFSLANTSRVTFTVTTLGTAASAVQTQATGGTTVTTLSGQDWNPAFSIFKGLAPQSSHEGGIGNTALAQHLPGYVAWGPYASVQPYTSATDSTYETTTGNTYTGSGTWGAYRSNADWTGGRDISATATYGNGKLIGTSQVIGEGNVSTLKYIDSESSAAGSHTVTWSGILGPGDYSLWVGGTNAAHALEQQANYQGLLAAHTADDAAIAAANAAYTGYIATAPTIVAAQAAYDAAIASHTATAAEKAAAKAALDTALASDPTAVALKDAYNAARTNVTKYENLVANLRSSYGFTIETTVAAVPVPGAVWLFGSAIAGLVGLGLRKQQLA